MQISSRGSTVPCVFAGFALIIVANMSHAQVMEGELRLTIRDSSGSALPAQVELTGRSPEFRAEVTADATGKARMPRLPQGTYRIAVTHPGFQEFGESVQIRSA